MFWEVLIGHGEALSLGNSTPRWQQPLGTATNPTLPRVLQMLKFFIIQQPLGKVRAWQCHQLTGPGPWAGFARGGSEPRPALLGLLALPAGTGGRAAPGSTYLRR